jgi:hypothetical protein
MKYHVYSRQLGGYLAMDFETREAAEQWRQSYLTHSPGETLDIVAAS